MPILSRFSHGTDLTRRDLISLESRLCDAVARILPFRTHSLYFPTEKEPEEPLWVAEERKLQLPIMYKDEQLGIFVARGVPKRIAQGLLPSLPEVMSLCVDNLALYKATCTDALTGLSTRAYLMACIAQEADLVRASFSHPPEHETDSHVPLHRACMGLVVFRLDSLRQIALDFGYTASDTLLKKLANALASTVPEQTLIARTGDFELAALLPAAASRVCRKLAEEVVEALRLIGINHGAGKHLNTTVSAGYAVYPRDMEGALFERDMEEQARVLLRKARFAATMASGDHVKVASDVIGFAEILTDGGVVLETHPLSRVLINLGRSVHAREGQRFSIWSASFASEAEEEESSSSLLKGELTILEVRENTSLAEVLYLANPPWNIESGDRLTLIPDGLLHTASIADSSGVPDEVTGLYQYNDFIAQWCAARDGCERFAVSILRFSGLSESQITADTLFVDIVAMCRKHLGVDALGGRYGITSLVFYHSGMSHEQARVLYSTLCKELEDVFSIRVVVGIGYYPFLDAQRSDALDNAVKALEYAQLLASPQVGVIGSTALTVSADKLFSSGDTFEAIKEYKEALLADDANIMAWNSLGVCMAGLGKRSEARRCFTEALQRNANDAITLYNLGTVCQALGEIDEARKQYRKCLRSSPDYVFALIRLGQLAENEKRYGLAQQYYKKAAKKENAGCLVHRHLARLALRQEKRDEAREELHKALLCNPQDAASMQLMARLYLDGGEDPLMAEALARQSVVLRPDSKASWLVLADALDARGVEEEAKEARRRASEL